MHMPLQIIRSICELKRSQHKVPATATMEEVLHELTRQAKEELREMCREGIIGYNKTINSVSFYEKLE